MPPLPDPYRVLGVPREATTGEIRTAHRRLAKRYHPDATGGDTERFLAVQEAYQVLSDPLRRREWDARHRAGPVRADATARPRPSPARTQGRGRGPAAPRAPGESQDGSAKAPAGAPGPRASRGQTNRQRRRPDPFSASGRQPNSDSYTWSAQDVPWWSGGPDRPRPNATAGTTAGPTDGTTEGTSSRGAPRSAGPAGPTGPSGADFDVYNRSSGAAWSMASRAYFRRAGSDVPKGAAEPFGQRWTTPAGTPSRGPGPSPSAASGTRPASPGARPSASGRAPEPARAPGVVFGSATGSTHGSTNPSGFGSATGSTFRSTAGAAFRRRTGPADPWPTTGARLLYALLGWIAPAVLLVLGPLPVPVPVTSGLLSALAVALLLAPRLAYLAAVGGMAALVAAAGFLLAQVVSGGQLGLAFDTLAAAVIVMVYLGAVILAFLDRPMPRPWADLP